MPAARLRLGGVKMVRRPHDTRLGKAAQRGSPEGTIAAREGVAAWQLQGPWKEEALLYF